jgi:hypothetical protein
MSRLFALLLANLICVTLLAQSPEPTTPQPAKGDAFSDQVMNRMLHDFQKGMQDHSSRRVLSEFDASRMEGYLQVEGQIEQLFNRYDTFHIHYRILQTSMEGQRGMATVEMQLEADPRQDGAPSLRRDGQMHFELLRSEKDWKIVDFQPRDFLTP